ncbi:MAG: heavy metal-binding domain-containing protein [Cocleimonas sp.]|nr:heavy metal-binding domain-containing protein [Cocleimonas sp.]
MIYQLIFVLILLILAYFIGTHLEKKHYKSIIEREKKLNALPAIAIKTPPTDGNFQQQLVLGSVTISVDYFKRFLASLHNFFGGRVTSYETLLDRARREALLRMKEAAMEKKATLILNVKYETASIYKGRNSTIGSVEVLAYGTAMIPYE